MRRFDVANTIPEPARAVNVRIAPRPEGEAKKATNMTEPNSNPAIVAGRVKIWLCHSAAVQAAALRISRAEASARVRTRKELEANVEAAAGNNRITSGSSVWGARLTTSYSVPDLVVEVDRVSGMCTYRSLAFGQ
jgi:hypothetical protein